MNEFAILTAAEYSTRASVLIERQRFGQARSVLAEALASHPDDADLLYQSARVDYLTEDLQQALETVRHVLAIEPLHLDARYLLACIYDERKELPASEAVLLELLREYPEFGMLYARYAMLMYRTFHIDKAKALAREALRLAPEDELALIACAIGDLIEGDRKVPAATLSALIRKYPENADTARLLVVHLIGIGQYWAAKRIAVELLKSQPNSRENLELVVQLETLSHWTVLPLWPLNRWGVAATVVVFIATMVIFKLLGIFAPEHRSAFSNFMIAFMAYSWFYPPLLVRWLKRRAGL